MQKKIYIIAAIVLLIVVLVFGLFLIKTRSNQTNNEPQSTISTQKEISLAELQKHSTSQDCWVFIGGQVFDATKVIAKYPEHLELLISVCGKDGSSVYTIQKYSDQPLDRQTITKLRAALGQYQIGLLVP